MSENQSLKSRMPLAQCAGVIGVDRSQLAREAEKHPDSFPIDADGMCEPERVLAWRQQHIRQRKERTPAAPPVEFMAWLRARISISDLMNCTPPFHVREWLGEDRFRQLTVADFERLAAHLQLSIAETMIELHGGGGVPPEALEDFYADLFLRVDAQRACDSFERYTAAWMAERFSRGAIQETGTKKRRRGAGQRPAPAVV